MVRGDQVDDEYELISLSVVSVRCVLTNEQLEEGTSRNSPSSLIFGRVGNESIGGKILVYWE